MGDLSHNHDIAMLLIANSMIYNNIYSLNLQTLAWGAIFFE